MSHGNSRRLLVAALLLCAADIEAKANPVAMQIPPRLAGFGIVGTEGDAAEDAERFDASAVRSLAAPGLSIESTRWAMTARKIATTVFYWDGVARGEGVIVGVVDSGIDLDHKEFTGRILPGTCFGTSICGVSGAMLGGDPGIYSNQKTHGTHVAGIAAGTTVGLATAAQLLPVKVCDTYSSSCPGNVDAGVVWASRHGAKVINVSLGGSGLYQADIDAAIRAIGNGSLLSVAAGNAGNSRPVSGFFGGAALKDGIRGAMIVVGATGLDNKLASFSQVPGSTCELHGGVNYCMRDYFVVAPGQGIKSSVGGGGYGTMSGTSMATPYVSGVVALIKGQWPTLTPFQVADIIFKTALDLGAPGPDDVYGRGAVDVAKAMSPVGGPAVIAATSGTTVSTATGPTGVLATTATGVLSAGLAQSALLKSVLVVDAYGRDFTVDFTKLAQASGLSLLGLLRDPFQRMMPFSFAQEGEAGTLSLAGNIVAQHVPADSGANASLEAQIRTTRPQVAMSFAPSRRVQVDFNQGMAISGYFNPFDQRAERNTGGLFLSASALNSPYAALTDGGAYSGARFSPTDGVTLRAGYASVAQKEKTFAIATASDSYGPAGFPRRDARSAMFGASWDFAEWGGIGFTASRTAEGKSVLGGLATGAFAAADRAATTSLGMSARAKIGGGWTATLAWNEGVTRLDVPAGGLFTATDAIRSRAYGLALTKEGVFGHDMVGLAVTRPLHIYRGHATLHAATAVEADGGLVFDTERLSLAASHPETDVELGYTARFLSGALTVQTNAAYQLDVAGQPGKSAMAVMSRATLAF